MSDYDNLGHCTRLSRSPTRVPDTPLRQFSSLLPQRHPQGVDFKGQPTRTFLIVFVVMALPIMLLWRFLLPGSRLFAWCVGANASAFVLWAYDKRQSRREGWRVPERVLHIMAILGAAPASLAAMSILRHKTQKRFFTTFYSILLVLELALGLLLLFPWNK